MRQWLDVPFSEKDLARRCGARWDPAVQRWYAPRPGMRGLEKWAALPDLPALLPGEDRSFGSGLYVEPIPSTAWWTHARSCIADRDWERVRRMAAARAGRHCEACGQTGRQAGGSTNAGFSTSPPGRNASSAWSASALTVTPSPTSAWPKSGAQTPRPSVISAR